MQEQCGLLAQGPGPWWKLLGQGPVTSLIFRDSVGLTGKGMWRKLAQEQQGEMFGTSSMSGEQPSLAGEKGDWVHKGRKRPELTKEGPPSLLHMVRVPSQGPSPEWMVANTD